MDTNSSNRSSGSDSEDSKEPLPYSNDMGVRETWPYNNVGGVGSESLSGALIHQIQSMQEQEQQLRQRAMPQRSQEQHDVLLQNELQRQQMVLLQQHRLRRLQEQQLVARLSASAHQDSLLHQNIFPLQNNATMLPELLLASRVASASRPLSSPPHFQQDLLLHQLQRAQQLQQQQQQLRLPSSIADLLHIARNTTAPAAEERMATLQPVSERSDQYASAVAAVAAARAQMNVPSAAGMNNAVSSPPLMNPNAGRASPPAKRMKKKGRNKPKRPLSAYNIFFREERVRVLKGIPKSDDDPLEEYKTGPIPKRRRVKHGKISFENLAKLVGQRWQELGPDQIAYYKKKANLDSERYRKEMEAYLLKGEFDGDDTKSQDSQDSDRKPAAT